MHELKTGLYADKLATFWVFPEGFYHLFVVQMTLVHFIISKNMKTCESG